MLAYQTHSQPHQMFHPNDVQLMAPHQHLAYAQQCTFQSQQAPASPPLAPPPPHIPHRTPPRKEAVCRYWQKEGRCPTRGCPFAASHTAANSPRYSKFMDALSPLDTNVTECVNVPRRANALEIREASPPGPTSRPKSTEGTPVNVPQRPAMQQHVKRSPGSKALEIRDPTPPKDVVAEAKAPEEDRDRTPSPPGSRLGRWMASSS